MKFKCLSEGKGYNSPPCHIVDLCGFQILIDCPLYLSSLSAFAPVAAYFSKREAGVSDLGPYLNAAPWYLTVNSLHLWDASFINVVLISSAMGMLGLPFLTREKGFSGKIYASEVSMRLGQLMMDDLISMDSEFRHICGWLPLYSTNDMKDCIRRVQPLRYGEEACYNGTWS